MIFIDYYRFQSIFIDFNQGINIKKSKMNILNDHLYSPQSLQSVPSIHVFENLTRN